MNTSQLVCFREVIRCRSFTEASRHLNVNQSTVSRQIAELEKELGAELIRRNNRKFELTGAGQLLLKDGMDLLSRVEAMKNQISVISRKDARPAVLAVLDHLMQSSGPLIQKLRSGELPDPSARLWTLNLPEMMQGLLDGSVDIGITFAHALKNHGEDLVAIPLFSESGVFFTAADKDRTFPDTMTEKQLSEYPLLIPEADYIPDFLEKILRLYEAEGTGSVILCPNYETVIFEASRKQGIGVLPACAVENAIKAYNLKMIDVLDTDTTLNYVISFQKHKQNPQIEAFCRYLEGDNP